MPWPLRSRSSRDCYHPRQEAVLLNAPVLVLNQNYEPLNVCDIRRAFNLLGSEKAELLERNHQVIHTPTLAIPAPSVIRLVYLVRRPRPRVKLSRREVFARDAHTCQYCGTTSRDLTIDHVMPKHRGGRHEWENLVTACRGCNHRKGSKTLVEARMRLLREPRAPRADVRYLYGTYLADEQNDVWRTYLFLSDSPGSRS
jgi:5-methylcytosine-specific restriction endonuclease McrA